MFLSNNNNYITPDTTCQAKYQENYQQYRMYWDKMSRSYSFSMKRLEVT